LHAYCRKLTGDLWDAEDLVQDTMLKGFATLGIVTGAVANPQAYLARIATNLWIDTQRRRAAEGRALALEMSSVGAAEAPDRSEVRDAGARLLESLAPQERAAVVLKDVLDMSLMEIAAMLGASEGAVKAALHRGRTRLTEEPPIARRKASPELVKRFIRALDAYDLPGLLALMLDSGRIDMSGVLLENGREEFSRPGGWLSHSVNPHADLPAAQRPPKWTNEYVVFRGEPIILHFMPPPFGHTLQAMTRFEEEDGKVARVRSYCFSPETVAEVAAALGLTVGGIFYQFPFG
jgi:RNA polymerase sigma-70 factor (ECF subfamily)